VEVVRECGGKGLQTLSRVLEMWVVSERRKRQSRRGTRGREGRGDFMHPLDVREEVNAESEKRGGNW